LSHSNSSPSGSSALTSTVVELNLSYRAQVGDYGIQAYAALP